MSTNEIDNLKKSIREFVETPEEGLAPTEKGGRFTFWCLVDLLGLSEEEAYDSIIDGSHDKLVDAVFESSGELIVIQCKYNKSHSYDSVLSFFTNKDKIESGEIRSKSDSVDAKFTIIRNYKEQDKPIRYYYITNSHISETERVDIDTHTSNSLIFMDIKGIYNYIQEETDNLPKQYKDKVFILHIYHNSNLDYDGSSLVLAIELEEIYKFAKDAGHLLFSSNIRHSLKRTKVNKGIEKTILEKPGSFWKYNNGITIVANDYHYDKNKLKLYVPQVVNGCQTVTAIKRIFDKLTDSQRKAYRGSVLTRIYRKLNNNDIINITKYTNAQNAVKGKDLFSLMTFHNQMHKAFKDYRYYLEIQRGSFSMLPLSEKSYYTGTSSLLYLTNQKKNWKHDIKYILAVQSYVSAFLQEPFKPRNSAASYAPYGNEYDNVFNGDTPKDPRYFLLPTLLVYYAENNLGYKKGSGYKRYARLFFVTTVFRTLLYMHQKITKNKIDTPESGKIIDLDIDFIYNVFSDETLFREIVIMVEEILKNALKIDSKIRDDLANNDYDTFFKRAKDKHRAYESLDGHIKDIIDEKKDVLVWIEGIL